MNRLVPMVAFLLGASCAMGGPPDPGEPFQIVTAQGALSAFVRSDDFDGKFCQYNESQQITSGQFLSESFFRECGIGPLHALSESALAAGPEKGSFLLSQTSHATTRSEGQPDIADATAEAVSEINLELDHATEVEITWSLDAEGSALSFVQLFDAASNSVLMEQLGTDGEEDEQIGTLSLWMEAGAWTLSVFTSSHAGSPNDWTSPDSLAAVDLLMQVVIENLIGDLNGDRRVDGADLAILLGRWGACDGDCTADFDGSGEVDGADLTLLLGAWTS